MKARYTGAKKQTNNQRTKQTNKQTNKRDKKVTFK